MAVLDIFSDYLNTSDHQFGVEQCAICMHPIYCVRNIIESFINNDFTVNVCVLDLLKAFDHMNHYVLLSKLMDRKIPNEVPSVLES